jgi:hypothetical protein
LAWVDLRECRPVTGAAEFADDHPSSVAVIVEKPRFGLEMKVPLAPA